jgi:hypothetical protein
MFPGKKKLTWIVAEQQTVMGEDISQAAMGRSWTWTLA